MRGITVKAVLVYLLFIVFVTIIVLRSVSLIEQKNMIKEMKGAIIELEHRIDRIEAAHSFAYTEFEMPSLENRLPPPIITDRIISIRETSPDTFTKCDCQE